MTAIEKAKATIKTKTTEELLNVWEWTATANCEEVPMIRGWIMDELEERDCDGFSAWIDTDCDDFKLREYIKA